MPMAVVEATNKYNGLVVRASAAFPPGESVTREVDPGRLREVTACSHLQPVAVLYDPRKENARVNRVKAFRENLEMTEKDAEQVSEEAGVEASKGAVELAAEHGIDLAAVEGSGENGKINKPDVQKVVEARAAAQDEAHEGQE